MEYETNIHKMKMSDIKTNDITNAFNFNTKLNNVLKWALIGLYVQNVQSDIEKMETLFKKENPLYKYRAWKSEAKAVYNALVKGTLKHNDIDIETLGDKTPEDFTDISIGVLYKTLPKKQSKPKGKPSDKKIMQYAIDSGIVPDDNIYGDATASKLLQAMSLNHPEIQKFYDQAKGEYAKAEQKKNLAKYLLEATPENMPDIEFLITTYFDAMAQNAPDSLDRLLEYGMAINSIHVNKHAISNAA